MWYVLDTHVRFACCPLHGVVNLRLACKHTSITCTSAHARPRPRHLLLSLNSHKCRARWCLNTGPGLPCRFMLAAPSHAPNPCGDVKSGTGVPATMIAGTTRTRSCVSAQLPTRNMPTGGVYMQPCHLDNNMWQPGHPQVWGAALVPGLLPRVSTLTTSAHQQLNRPQACTCNFCSTTRLHHLAMASWPCQRLPFYQFCAV
jgi:hypothetical protein